MKDEKGRSQLVMNRSTVGFDLYNGSLVRQRHVSFPSSTLLTILDIDGDGLDEMMATDILRRTVTVFRNDLRYPVSQSIELDGQTTLLYSVNKNEGEVQSLYLQSGNSFTLLKYEYNKAWPMRFAKYASLFTALLLFILLIRKIQQVQIRQRTEAERKITDLQLRIIRNQLDPHFTMNAINSMISNLSGGNSDEVKKQLMQFSDLHRSLILDSNRIMHSLREEIKFTEDYLSLEKCRFVDRFDSRMDVGKEVNTEVDVPKMILQVYVENALKHGILPLRRKGMLLIKIRGADPLVIEISDNGAGRNSGTGQKENHTGIGIAAMEQYYALFGKLKLSRIESSITDLLDENGQSAGTRIQVTLYSFHERQ
jgi:two-component sensor histidine kinase